MFLSFCVAAAAAELVPTLALPSAGGIPAGEGQAAAGGIVAGGDSPSAALTLRGVVGVTGRLAINGALELPEGGLVLGLRYDVVQTDALRVAPFALGAVHDDLVTGTPRAAAAALGAAFGVAVEGGSPTARFDLSLPLVATGVDPLVDPAWAPLTLGSTGFTVRVTPRHALRVGIESYASPGLTYRYGRDRWYLQATTLWSVLREQPLAAAEAGLRF